MINLVVGSKKSGKTTWCSRLVEQAKNQGRNVSGLLSPGAYRDGSKIAIDLQLIATGERRRLAVQSDRDVDRPTEMIRVGGWLFDPDVIAWGNQALLSLGDQDIFILDELGPLEFHSKAGLSAGFQVIEARRFREAYVVVRLSLIDAARRLWPEAQLIQVEGLSGTDL